MKEEIVKALPNGSRIASGALIEQLPRVEESEVNFEKDHPLGWFQEPGCFSRVTVVYKRFIGSRYETMFVSRIANYENVDEETIIVGSNLESVRFIYMH